MHQLVQGAYLGFLLLIWVIGLFEVRVLFRDELKVMVLIRSVALTVYGTIPYLAYLYFGASHF
jgi:hypothetical protein